MSFDPEFNYRLLYCQNALSGEGQSIRSSIYAMRWNYPGATSQTTSRARITTIITPSDEMGEISQTSIELWKETGWILLDEVFDDSLADTSSLEEVEEICLKYLEAFLMGVPTSVIPDDLPTPRPQGAIPKKPSKDGNKKANKLKKIIESSKLDDTFKSVLKESDNPRKTIEELEKALTKNKGEKIHNLKDFTFKKNDKFDYKNNKTDQSSDDDSSEED